MNHHADLKEREWRAGQVTSVGSRHSHHAETQASDVYIALNQQVQRSHKNSTNATRQSLKWNGKVQKSKYVEDRESSGVGERS